MQVSGATTELRLPRARARTPDRLAVMLFGAAAFLVVLALLAAQMRSGVQPAGPRTVVLRRVYSTRIVETVIGPAPGGAKAAASVTQSVSSSGGSPAAAPVAATRTS
jgi:hypothetical protein